MESIQTANQVRWHAPPFATRRRMVYYGAAMRSRLNKEQGRQRRHDYFVRGIALYFILFTFGDIALPQIFCREEPGCLLTERSASVRTSDGTKNEAVAVSRQSDDSQPSAPSDQAPHEEDCFCCCGHIVLVAIFADSNALSAESLLFPVHQDRLPTSPPQNQYRPPRSAQSFFRLKLPFGFNG